jgi:hypothetical protein
MTSQPKKLRMRHSNKQYVPELLHMLCNVVECYRDGNGTLDAKIDGLDYYDLTDEALRYAKVYNLSAAAIWFARNVADEPLIPQVFKSLASQGVKASYWIKA